MDEILELVINLTNMTFLRELIEDFDKEFDISLKGEQISDGDLPGVVKGILDELFVTDKPIGKFCSSLVAFSFCCLFLCICLKISFLFCGKEVPETSPTSPSTATERTTIPIICDADCAGKYSQSL